METRFEDMWSVLYDHGASDKKEEGTRRYWASLTPEQQHEAFTTISKKLKEGKFVQYDPIRAIKENIKPVCALQMAFEDYYKKYGTTEDTDGWKRKFLPEERRTVYVKG